MHRLLIVCLLLGATAAAQTPRTAPSAQTRPAALPDFTGNWTLDTAQTHGEGSPASLTLHVTQTATKLTADRVAGTPMGEVHDTVVVALDGSPITTSVTMGGTPMQWTTTGKWDGAVLVISRTADAGGGSTLDQVERWSLDDGGAEMHIQSTMSAGGQSAVVTLALTRRPRASRNLYGPEGPAFRG